MREIKFRGRSSDDDKWVYGSLIISKREHVNKDFECIEYFIEDNIYKNGDYIGKKVRVKPETVGQYTGLNDKNGKQIYEGDICKDREGISIIVFDSLLAAFVASFETDNMDIFSYLEIWKPEVIGNIYENPELLEVQNAE